MVFCDVVFRVRNCASTWANQTIGSLGRKGGSLMLMKGTGGWLDTAGVEDELAEPAEVDELDSFIMKNK